MNSPTKTCNSCGCIKPAADFPKNAAKCRPCKKLYMKQWKKDNAERVAKYQKDWLATKPTYKQEWLAKNPDYFSNRWSDNRDVLLANQRERVAALKAIDPDYRRKEYRINAAIHIARACAYARANREKVNIRQRQYFAKYPEKWYAAARKRKSKLLSARTRNEFDVLVFEEAFRLRRCRALATGIKWHIDHIEPLQGKDVCGLHNGFNLAVIPAKLNLKKANKRIDVRWTQLDWNLP